MMDHALDCGVAGHGGEDSLSDLVRRGSDEDAAVARTTTAEADAIRPAPDRSRPSPPTARVPARGFEEPLRRMSGGEVARS